MQGRLDEAEAELEELLREHPRFAEAYNNIAMVHIRREDWGEAERLARTAVDLDPEAVDPTMTLAGVLHQLGRYGEEIVTLKSLAVRHQERLDIVARYGVALAAAGDCSLALPQLSSALHEYFDETDVVIAAARCEEQQGDADRAIELFQRVAQVAPPGPIREEALGAVQRLALARR
jgi:Flp pilus assembly protein TadD